MNMKTSVVTCFKKFITVKGRASRSECLWFWLFVIIVNLFLALCAIVLPIYVFGFIGNLSLMTYYAIIITDWLPNLWAFITLPPVICVTIRRLHDVNLSGWWILYYHLFLLVSAIMFLLFEYNFLKEPTLLILIIWVIIRVILLACAISPFYFLFKKGTAGDNRFGADPLAE